MSKQNELLSKNYEIFNSLPFGVAVFDDNFNVTYQNLLFSQFVNDEEFTIGDSILNSKIITKNRLTGQVNSVLKGLAFETQISSTVTLNGNEIKIFAKGTPIIINEELIGGLLIIEDTHIDSNLNASKSNFIALNKIIAGLYHKFILTDPEGTIKYFTEDISFQNIRLNLQKETKIYDQFTKLINNDLNKVYKNLKEKVLYDAEYQVDNEQKITIELEIIPIKQYDEAITHVLILPKVKILESDHSDDLMNEIEELRQYETIINNVIDAIVVIDEDGKIKIWNNLAAKFFNKSKSEVYEKHIYKIIPGFNEVIIENLKAELQNKKRWEGQFKLNDPGIADLLQVTVSRDTQNRFIIICEDITYKKLAENELRKSEEKFRAIVTDSSESICTFDLDGFITYSNKTFNENFFVLSENSEKINILELIERNNHQRFLNIEELIQGRAIELLMKVKNGLQKYFMVTISSVMDLNDNPKYYNAILTDINERKEFEKSFLLTKSVFEASQDGIVIFNERKLISANDSFIELFGYDNLDEVLDKDPLDFVSNESIPSVAKSIQSLEQNIKKTKIFDFTAVTKSNKEFFASVSASSYTSEDQLYLVLLFRDITDKKMAQEALEESEERYRSITENIDEFIWSAERKDKRLRMSFITKAFEKITGLRIEDLLKNQLLWFQIIHPDDYQNVITRLKRLFRNTNRISDEIEFRIINIDGGTVWLQNKINIIRENNVIVKAYGLVSDISMKKRAEEELKLSTENLKMLNDTKDRFISIVSHDLRTPFSSILGFTDLLINDPEMGKEKQMEYIQFIQESSKNMLSLVNSLLDWTRLQTGRIIFSPQKINISILTKKIFQILAGAAIQKNILLESELPDELYIHADENLMMQLFNNLVSNSLKFTNKGGFIKIYAEPYIEQRQILFVIKDNGVGIKQENLNKLFKIDTKFTLKGTAGEKGSGLGLSLCKDIIDKHGGNIWVESIFGKGSEFKFTLPITSSKILLIDDSKTDRILYKKIIQSISSEYEMIEAGDGQEALELIEEQQPAVVITDHLMPKMSGYELIKKITFNNSKYKPSFIVLSSELNEVVIEEYRELGLEYIFTKPVNLNLFKNAINQAFKKIIFN